ncbi:MAG: ABC transporter substrate-binding protein [Candidatus Anammoxibacter sp.]
MTNYKVIKKLMLFLFMVVFGVVVEIDTALSEVHINKAIEKSDSHPEYIVLLKHDDYLETGKEVEIDICIQYGPKYGRGKKSGETIKNLQVVYDRIVEVFIVSDDFEYFFHTRPEDFSKITPAVKASGVFKIKHTFPRVGSYRVVVCFSHKGRLIYKHFNLRVSGKLQAESSKLKANQQFPIPDSHSENPQSAIFSGYNVLLKIVRYPLIAQRRSELVYRIQDKKGDDVDNLEVFMGTEMHFVTWRDDFEFFGYGKTRPPEGKPGTVLLVPPIKTEIRYGSGILREISRNGRMLIEHGKVGDLLPAGKFSFKVSDPEANIKVEIGDWVEFWVDNNPKQGIVITRIEPLAAMPSVDDDGVYQWAGNLPIYPGPTVPMEHIFPTEGRYVVFSQFKHQGKVVTSRFFVDVKTSHSLGNIMVLDGPDDSDKGIVKLSQDERNGQQIYRTSKSSSGKTIYIKQEDGSKIDASSTGITCIGCHGADGRGGQEGGVLTSDIRYEFLTKPYGITHTSGRKHPPYTDDLIKTAITDGVDPASNKLDPTMVRWEMSDSDINDLCAYIHRLSEMGKPGVTNDTIRVGCVLDISGPLSETGLAAKTMIEAAFKRINEGGKIYGRSLKLVVADGGNSPARSLETSGILVEEENVFCFLGNLGDAATNDVIPFLAERGIPVVAPLSPTYQPDSVVEQNTFFLFPSVAYQTRVMVDYIVRARKKGGTKPAVAAIYSLDKFGKSGHIAAVNQLRMYGNSLVAEIGYDYKNLDAAKIADEIVKSGAENVIILTPDARILTVVAGVDRLRSSSPIYFLNNMLVIKNIMKIPRASQRFILAQNFSFSGKDNPLSAEFLEIIKDVSLNARNVMIQMAAFTGAKLLEEGLRLSGRDLTRKSFVEGLERLQVNTGLFGVITYKPGNHSGDSGIFLVRPDEASGNFVPVTRWMRPTQRDIMF